MTSLREEGSPEGVDCFRKRAAYAFAREFGRRQRIVTPRRLLEPLPSSHASDRVRRFRVRAHA